MMSAKSEHHKLCGIIFEEFQPVVCDHDTSTSRDRHTNGRIDRQTTCRSNTVLCVPPLPNIYLSIC